MRYDHSNDIPRDAHGRRPRGADERAGPGTSHIGHAAAANGGPGPSRWQQRLRTEQVVRPQCSTWCDHWPGPVGFRSAVGSVGRRERCAVSPDRSRPRDSCSDPRCGQNACNSAARVARRRQVSSAQIGQIRRRAHFLTVICRTHYMRRSLGLRCWRPWRGSSVG